MRPIPALRVALASALAAGCIGTPEESVLPSAVAGGGLTERWELDAASTREPNYIRPHRQNYALLARWSDDPNQEVLDAAAGAVDATPLQSVELEYQPSFKVKLLDDTLLGGDVCAAYNQLSHWQAYNWSQSAPFRETNY